MAKLNVVAFFLAAFAVYGARAAPPAERRQSITALTAAQISAFKPFSFFAATAYCNPSVTRTWTCGGKSDLADPCCPCFIIKLLANCNGNPDFIPVASGGDGSSVQFCEFRRIY